MTRRKADKRGRSCGTLGSFVALERYLLNSRAWLDLTPLARACYIELASAYSGSNNGRIVFSSRNMGERLKVSKATASRAISELESHGFIEIAQRSSFQNKIRLAAEYRLTAFKCDRTGNLPSKSFMRWAPEIQNTVSPVRPYGFTHETNSVKKGQKQASRFHPCNREGHFEGVHGFTHEPLLYSSHRPLPQTQVAEEQRGAANQRACAVASNSPSAGPDSFTFVTGEPIKSLEALQAELHPDFQSWQPIAETNLAKSLRCFNETREKKPNPPELAA